jgi:hypothetical protein
MDQWTAKSIHLLIDGPKSPKLDGLGWNENKATGIRWQVARVSDQNTHEEYEVFCQVIEELALELNSTGSKAEELIFSVGARGRGLPGAWRRHVWEHWRATK